MNLPGKIRQTLQLTDFELRRLFRQRRAYAGLVVNLLLTALCAVGFWLRQQRHGEDEFAGRLIRDLVNGIAFSETVLLPGIYILLPMVVGILTAGVFAGEFELGQIRTLCLRPVSRGQLLFAKFASLVIYSYFLLLSLLVFSYVIGALIFGISGDVIIFGPAFLGRGTGIYILNESVAWERLLLSYFLAGYAMISVVALFLLFSVICRKVTLAAVIPLGIYYTSYMLDALPFMESLQRFLPTRYLMVWKYVMSPGIQWEKMAHDGLFLLAYTLVYLTLAGFIFSSSDV